MELRPHGRHQLRRPQTKPPLPRQGVVVTYHVARQVVVPVARAGLVVVVARGLVQAQRAAMAALVAVGLMEQALQRAARRYLAAAAAER